MSPCPRLVSYQVRSILRFHHIAELTPNLLVEPNARYQVRSVPWCHQILELVT